MKDRLKKSSRKISGSTRSAISSPASGSGATRSGKPVGPIPILFGPDPAPASPSARQGRKADLMTPAISGPTGSGSSESLALTQSLGNRLRVKTASIGSTLFRLTWKERVTPLGRRISALRASVLRTYDSDSTSWATPATREKNVRTLEGSLREIKRKGSPQDLNQAAVLASWPTPNALAENRGGLQSNPLAALKRRAQGHQLNLDDAATLADWPSPMAGTPAQKGYNEAGNTDSSRKTVALVAPWITPQTHDTTTRGNTEADHHYSPHDLSNQVLLTASGPTQNGSPASTEKPGQLNPEHSRWLQGLPIAWGSCGGMVIRLRRPSRKRSSKPISK